MRRKTVILLVTISLAACRTATTPTVAHAAPAAKPAAGAATDTLYKRLGGYDAIAAVTDDFLGRMIADKQLGRYFTGLSDNSRERLRQHVIDLLCFYAKGPCLYVGRDIAESHTGLHITAQEWDLAMRHMAATLAKFKVPANEQRELTAAVESFREDIVGH